MQAPAETDQDIDSFRAHAILNEAIQLIPDVEKAAYKEALERVSHLVMTESDPLCFLHRENFNAWNAAVRLVTYWEERRKIFGDRAFLPLTLVGDSALSEEAIQLVRSWNHNLLIPNDSSGRSVTCLDVIKNPSDVQFDAVLQVQFYRMFILMRNPRNCKDGYVCLIVKRAGVDDWGKIRLRRVKLVVEMMRKAMPIRFHSIHLFWSVNGFHPIVFKLLNWCMSQHSNTNSNNNNIYSHPCKTPEERAAALEPFGFTKDRLPKILGGSWEPIQWDGLRIDQEAQSIGNNSGLRGIEFNDSTACLSTVHRSFDEQEQRATDEASAFPYLFSRLADTIESGNDGRGPFLSSNETNTTPLANKNQRSLTKKRAIVNNGSFHSKSEKIQLLGIGEFDLLLGRGWYSEHEGNRYFRTLITSHCAHYKAAKSRIDKKQIKLEVLNRFKEKGRIMKYDDNSNAWKEVSSSYALERIAESFHYVFRKMA